CPMSSAVQGLAPAAQWTAKPAEVTASLPMDVTGPRTRVASLVGVLVVVVFVVGFAAWSTLAPLAEAALAPGTIKAEGSRRTLQHLEGGIVREILVRDGD